MPVTALRTHIAGTHLIALVTDTNTHDLTGIAHLGSRYTRRHHDPTWILGGQRPPGPWTRPPTGLTLLIRIPAQLLPATTAENDTSFLALVARKMTTEHLVTNQRGCNKSQKAVLDWWQPTCVAAGCNRTATTENDHRIDWAQCRITDIVHIDRLCPFHHKQKTHHDYQLAPGHGRRPLRPPPSTADDKPP